MALIFLLIGAICTVLFIINNLAHTARRDYDIGRWELRLGFFVALMPAIALVIDNLDTADFDTIEQVTFLLIIPLIIVHIGLIVVEAFRPQGWRQSRGWFGLGIGVLLLIANFAYNFLSLNAQLSTVASNVVPTPVNAAPDSLTPCELAFADVGTDVFDAIQDYTGLDEQGLQDEFIDGTRSLGRIIENNDREPTAFVESVVQSFREQLPDLVSQECLPPLAAAGAPAILRQQLNSYIDIPLSDVLVRLNSQFAQDNDDAPDPDTLSAEDQRATRVALITALPTEAELPSPTPTYTPSRTPTVTPTRTPRPTLSPTPTRERYQTPTPTLTPTLPDPCLATASFNVNMRTLPDLEDGDVIQTIPYESVISIFAPNDDKTWWYGQYEGDAGWISAEFIALTRACDDLPPRDP